MKIRYAYTDKSGKHKAILHTPFVSSAYRDIFQLMEYFNRNEKNYYWNGPKANLRISVYVYSGRARKGLQEV